MNFQSNTVRAVLAGTTLLLVVGGWKYLTETQEHRPAPAFSITLQSARIDFSEDDRAHMARIGEPRARHTAYAAIDYKSGPSRRFRKALDGLQESFGEDLSITILPEASDDEGREIHRILLTLFRADPRLHADIESRLLEERLLATPSAVINAAVRIAGSDRFHAVHKFHKDQLSKLMHRTAKVLNANAETRGAFPQLTAQDSVLVGFDGNPTRLENHIRTAFNIRPLTEIPFRPVLHLAHNTIDLGQVKMGTTVQIQIPFENTGNESLSIGLVKAGPGARVIEVPEIPVEAGEESSIGIALRTASTNSSLDRIILIGCNDGSGFRKLQLRGQVIPRSENPTTAHR